MGIGIDRLALFLANKQSIKEVILFPQMKSTRGSVSKIVGKILLSGAV